MIDQAVASPRTTSRAANIALWVLQVLLGLGFIGSAIAKFTGVEIQVQLFDEIGAGSWLLYLTGVLELAGGIGLLIPRLAGLAALGLIGVMAGAVFTSLFLVDNHSPIPASLYLILAALIAWGRRDRTVALLRRTP